MAEIVNLRRARKAKARAQGDKEAEANRVKHGTTKAAHKLARARIDKNARDVDAHKLEDDPNEE